MTPIAFDSTTSPSEPAAVGVGASVTRTLILGDLHLSAHTAPEVGRDLVTLVRQNPGARFIFAGDFLDLSAESPRVPSGRALAEGFGRNPEVARAFAEHLDVGGSLVFLGGNHDPELGAASAPAELARVLGVGAASGGRIASFPWFFREGGLHVEHGNIFDPDNAPEHPLVVPAATLGVHFVEEFIAPTGAYAYLNANDGTPLKLFLSAFRWYGLRGPHVVYMYFSAAAKALAKSGPFHPGKSERARGAAAMQPYATRVGLPLDACERVAALCAPQTLTSLRDTVARLYLDRVLSTFAALGGLVAASVGGSIVGGAMLGAGALGLATSWLRGHDRYGGSVAQRLEDGALGIADATGAKLVVLGHAHRASERGAYANTGSFAFPRGLSGRPLLVVGGDATQPSAERVLFTARGA